VRRDLIPSLAKIHFNTKTSVDWVSLVWVDNNTKEARVGVDKFGLKSCFQVMENRSIVQVS
jgi:hypothetical protein